jgi:signal transduction histidine kinase
LQQPDNFLNKNIFLLYKTYDDDDNESSEARKKLEKGEKMSIQNVLDLERVDKMIFKFDQQDSKYFQVKVSKMQIGGEERTIVQFSDVSDSIRYMEAKTENTVLQMTNATVSHELRNPLNSIKAQNIMQ